jgi:hypothetical protein
MVQQRRVHRRDAFEHRHAIALDRLEDGGGVEARNEREHRPGGDACVQPAGLPERVEQRQRAEDRVLRVQREELLHDLGVAGQVGVRQLGALGLARRSRRVEDHRRVVALAARGVTGWGGHRIQQLLERARQDDQTLAARSRGAGMGRLGDVVPRKQHARARVREVVRDFALFEQHVHRHHHAACSQDAVIDERKLWDVRKHHPDPVAGPYAARLQQLCDARARVMERAIADDAVAETQRSALTRHQVARQVGVHDGSSS